jgi:hypothetical protein
VWNLQASVPLVREALAGTALEQLERGSPHRLKRGQHMALSHVVFAAWLATLSGEAAAQALNGPKPLAVSTKSAPDALEGTAWTAVELSSLALTRAKCPESSLHDQIAKQWTYVRSFLIKDGHLFLALMADGGTYEFAPVAPKKQ